MKRQLVDADKAEEQQQTSNVEVQVAETTTAGPSVDLKRSTRTVRKLPKNTDDYIKDATSTTKISDKDKAFEPIFDYKAYVSTYAFNAEYDAFLKMMNNSDSDMDKKTDYVRQMKVDRTKNVLVSYGFILPNTYEAVFNVAYAYLNLICQNNGFFMGGNPTISKGRNTQNTARDSKAFNIGCAILKNKLTHSQELILILSGKKTAAYFHDNGMAINEYISKLITDNSPNKHLQIIQQFLGKDKPFTEIKHFCDQVSSTFIAQQAKLKNRLEGNSPYIYGCSEPVLADEIEKFLIKSPENHIVEGTVEFHFKIQENQKGQQSIIAFNPQKSCKTSCQVHAHAGYYDEMRSVSHKPLSLSEPRVSSIKNSMQQRIENEKELIKTFQSKLAELEQKKLEVDLKVDLTKENLQQARELRHLHHKEINSLPKMTDLEKKECDLADEDKLNEDNFLLAPQVEEALLAYRNASEEVIPLLSNRIAEANRQVIWLQNCIFELREQLQYTLKFRDIREINELITLLEDETKKQRENASSCGVTISEIKLKYSAGCQMLEKIKLQVLEYQLEIKSEKDVNAEQKSRLNNNMLMFQQHKSKAKELKRDEAKLLSDVGKVDTKMSHTQEQIQSMQERLDQHKTVRAQRFVNS